MKNRKFIRLLSFILALVLTVAMALTTGCKDNETNANTDVSDDSGTTAETVGYEEIGEGALSFYFTAVDTDGKTSAYRVHTDKKTVGEALLALGLIDGDDGQYGLYVKTVCGSTYDYDKDGKYWAFYVNGAYASAGVDTTDIVEGESYMFKAE